MFVKLYNAFIVWQTAFLLCLFRAVQICLCVNLNVFVEGMFEEKIQVVHLLIKYVNVKTAGRITGDGSEAGLASRNRSFQMSIYRSVPRYCWLWQARCPITRLFTKINMALINTIYTEIACLKWYSSHRHL